MTGLRRKRRARQLGTEMLEAFSDYDRSAPRTRGPLPRHKSRNPRITPGVRVCVKTVTPAHDLATIQYEPIRHLQSRASVAVATERAGGVGRRPSGRVRARVGGTAGPAGF